MKLDTIEVIGLYAYIGQCCESDYLFDFHKSVAELNEADRKAKYSVIIQWMCQNE